MIYKDIQFRTKTSLSAKTKPKPTPGIFQAVKSGDIGYLSQLIKEGADLGALQDNMTPYDLAVKMRNKEAIELLMKAKNDCPSFLQLVKLKG